MGHDEGPPDSPYARLTPAQHEAVFAEDPRLAVFAGAGAGKTRVLTLRAARLIDEGVDPSHLLIVTFSRKAAQELRTRLWRLGVEGVRAGTFHRTALELLEISRAERGLTPPRLLTDRRGSLERVAAGLGVSSAPAAGQVDTEVTWAKASGLTPESYAAAARRARRTRMDPELVGLVWQTYETNKTRQGFVDFDDLITEAADALDDPTFASAIHWRSRHVLVDEFQDVNPAQFMLVERLLAPSTTLFCVGDPNQSIYGFNGADPGLLRHLGDRLPGTKVLVLDTNHRSTPEIVATAATVLPSADRRALTTTQQSGSPPELHVLSDDRAEAAFVARRALAVREPGSRWRSMAILARTNVQLRAVEEACSALSIPTVRLAPEVRQPAELRSPDRRPALAAEAPADAVALGTFHRSKGLEWPTVFVIGASEGFVPHASATSAAAQDEERRLLYVAMTRAERRLVITWAQRRDADEPSRAPARRRSPYLDDVERHLDTLGAAERPSSSARGAAQAARLRAMLEERATERS